MGQPSKCSYNHGNNAGKHGKSNYIEATKKSSVNVKNEGGRGLAVSASCVLCQQTKCGYSRREFNAIITANTCISKMSGHMESKIRKDIEGRSVATRDDRCRAVDRWNLFTRPQYPVPCVCKNADQNYHYLCTCIYIKTEYSKITS